MLNGGETKVCMLYLPPYHTPLRRLFTHQYIQQLLYNRHTNAKPPTATHQPHSTPAPHPHTPAKNPSRPEYLHLPQHSLRPFYSRRFASLPLSSPPPVRENRIERGSSGTEACLVQRSAVAAADTRWAALQQQPSPPPHLVGCAVNLGLLTRPSSS